MQVSGIDPRDVQFELDAPHYRVYLFEPDGRSDEYHLTEARDAADVLDLAKAVVRGCPGADLRRVMRDPHPPADLRESRRAERSMSVHFVRRAWACGSTGCDAEGLEKSWPWCRIDRSAFVEKVSGSRLDCP